MPILDLAAAGGKSDLEDWVLLAGVCHHAVAERLWHAVANCLNLAKLVKCSDQVESVILPARLILGLACVVSAASFLHEEPCPCQVDLPLSPKDLFLSQYGRQQPIH